MTPEGARAATDADPRVARLADTPWHRRPARFPQLATSVGERAQDDRHVRWPEQALSHRIGEMTTRALRRRAEEWLGATFDLRAFHDTVPALGSVPLPARETPVDAWIARAAVS